MLKLNDYIIIIFIMKKVLFIAILLTFSVLAFKVLASSSRNIYFFYGEGCPHCAKEEVFLNQLAAQDSGLKIYSFEVWGNKANLNLLKSVGEALKADVSGVPFTVVGENYVSGYLNYETTGKQIENYIEECSRSACQDVVGGIIAGLPSPNNQNTNQEPVNPDKPEENKSLLEKITLPLFGEIELKNYSLPIITFLIAALDGFNPCAMWVLLFLISLLLGMENRKRMWALGSAFIIASAAVYFAFMAAWLNLLLFLGFIIWIRILIGLVALGSGGYHLREWWVSREAYCKVTKNEKRQRIFARLKEITQNKKFLIALMGIILLAFAVNLVEAVCSAGLPAVYSQILALSNLSTLGYYFYILLYIFVFMLDDLLVFIVAMVTLKVSGLTGKFSRFSNLIGGILMLLIGLLLILKPDWLMFG